MCTHKCRNNIDRVTIIQSFRYTQLLEFVFHGETVAAFRFNGCDTLQQHLVQASMRLIVQFLLRCRPCTLHRVKNAAALRQYVQIGDTRPLQHQLMLAGTAMHEMRMRVDQPWCDHTSANIDNLDEPTVNQVATHIMDGTKPRNFPLADSYYCIFNLKNFLHFLPAARCVSLRGNQTANPCYEQINTFHLSSPPHCSRIGMRMPCFSAVSIASS
ncbi:hypothetical protein D3C85_1047300 [compost metagenome]